MVGCARSVLPLETMLMFMGPAAAREHADVHFLFCCQRPWLCLWSMLQSRAMLVSVVCAPTGAVLMPMLPPKAMQMAEVCAPAWSLVDVHEPCCHQGTRWCPWPVLLPRATMASEVHVAAESCVDISGSCCRQRPCESPCSMPPLTERARKLLLQW